MIGFIRGQVAHMTTDFCLVDVNGVGYRIFVSLSALGKLRLGQDVLLYTSLQVREDAMLLYGFLSLPEQDLFNLLLTVSGVGPKVAMSILSAIEPNDFCLAIQQKKITTLTKLPGIGKKTAERMILELKDKVTPVADSESDFIADETEADESVWQEAVQALCALGYSRNECLEVLKRKGQGEAGSVEDLIKWALREMAKRA